MPISQSSFVSDSTIILVIKLFCLPIKSFFRHSNINMHIASSLRSLLLLAPMAAVWSEATPILPSLRGLIAVSTNI